MVATDVASRGIGMIKEDSSLPSLLPCLRLCKYDVFFSPLDGRPTF